MKKTIDYILEVAKCGGITKAASNLYITPSALSKFVQAKEDELQVKLFNRVGKKFVLTYAGERYVEMLQKMYALQQEMDIEMNRISSMYMGRLRIGFQISLADVVIKNIVPEFQRAYPNVQIMLEENNSTELLKMLKNNQVDLIISTIEGTATEFECEILSEGEVILAVDKDNPLCKEAVKKSGFKYPWIDFSKCAHEKTVMLSKIQLFRTYTDQIYENYDIKPQQNIFVSTTRTALLCVENKMGITVTLDLLVYQNNFNDKIKMLSFGESRIINRFAVLSSPNSMLKDIVKAFADICKQHFIY